MTVEERRDYKWLTYQVNGGDIRRRVREYYSKNRQARIEYSKKRYRDNPDPEGKRQRYLRDRESILHKARKYYSANRDKIKAYRDSPEVRARLKAYWKLRRETDANHRIKVALRCRIYDAISRNKGARKAAKTEELVGCNVSFLKGYLEGKFVPRMTWDNYGLWQLDHVIPCAEFDLRDERQQRQCFHYTNLQPLWAKDNQIKGSKFNRKLFETAA